MFFFSWLFGDCSAVLCCSVIFVPFLFTVFLGVLVVSLVGCCCAVFFCSVILGPFLFTVLLGGFVVSLVVWLSFRCLFLLLSLDHFYLLSYWVVLVVSLVGCCCAVFCCSVIFVLFLFTVLLGVLCCFPGCLVVVSLSFFAVVFVPFLFTVFMGVIGCFLCCLVVSLLFLIALCCSIVRLYCFFVVF